LPYCLSLLLLGHVIKPSCEKSELPAEITLAHEFDLVMKALAKQYHAGLIKLVRDKERGNVENASSPGVKGKSLSKFHVKREGCL